VEMNNLNIYALQYGLPTIKESYAMQEFQECVCDNLKGSTPQPMHAFSLHWTPEKFGHNKGELTSSTSTMER